MSEQQKSREERFVDYVLEKTRLDTGFAARMRRADNRATAPQSWDCLAAFGVNLTRERELLPFALIGASLCRAKVKRNGETGLGRAMRLCFAENSDHGSLRMRRLLACDSAGEVCRILRPLLMLLAERLAAPLDYAGLLRELLLFGAPGQEDLRERIKARWAQDFYSAPSDADDGVTEGEA